MFNRKPQPAPTGLEEAIARLHADMQTYDPHTDQFKAMAENLTLLYKLREHDKPEKYRPSADTLTVAAANLTAVIVIVAYEQKHVIATKAMTFWQKLG